MSRHAVHAALQPSNRINLGTFGPEPKADPAGYMAEDSAWPGGLVGNVADSDRVMQQRNADMLAGNPTRSINGPLPSADWDAFFGAMQRKESNAENHGLNFRPNIAGHGPGEGIGQLGFINGQGSPNTRSQGPVCTRQFPRCRTLPRASTTRIVGSNHATDASSFSVCARSARCQREFAAEHGL
jgi:hypothetical protein